ncbi:gas vesicle protein [Streptomyces tendae]|uniref:gas vesicle protein n=1 Tax=Streptomyces tendae TaxID=1932 RepID=UPI00371B920C
MVETLLDKGLVLNADIVVSVAGVELPGVRLRAALASFETAVRVTERSRWPVERVDLLDGAVVGRQPFRPCMGLVLQALGRVSGA